MTISKILSWTAVILWMATIFYLSHQPATASNQLSTGITEGFAKTVENVATKSNFNMINLNHTVRKNAHFIAYLILSVLVINALRRSHVKEYRSAVLALLI